MQSFLDKFGNNFTALEQSGYSYNKSYLIIHIKSSYKFENSQFERRATEGAEDLAIYDVHIGSIPPVLCALSVSAFIFRIEVT